jgi:16S rRNA (cytidine1402-2'-O)-methyltransferase
MIFLETPHRLLDALRDLQALLGDRRIGVARELTKIHEEIWRGNLSGALAYFTEHTPRGEFVLLVSGAAPTSERWSEVRLRQAIQENLANGQTPSQAASQVAAASGWPRRQIYQLALQLRANSEADS